MQRVWPTPICNGLLTLLLIPFLYIIENFNNIEEMLINIEVN